MKQNNRQTLPLGRSTSEENAGLSLPQPSLFAICNDSYEYYNESVQTIVRNSSDFIARLTRKKFNSCKSIQTFIVHQFQLHELGFRI